LAIMQTIMKTRTETQSCEKIFPYCYFLTITTHGYQLLRKPLGKKLRRPVRKIHAGGNWYESSAKCKTV
jgi:hypothetical protein